MEMMEVRHTNNQKPVTQTFKLYEEVVIKNFQVLKAILPKMNSLYQLNQQLERSVSGIESRLIKMQNDHENLHYEMRTSNLAIDSKLNSIIAQYNNLSNQTLKFKKQTQFLTKQIRETKSRQIIEKNGQNVQKSDRQLTFDLQAQIFEKETHKLKKKIKIQQKVQQQQQQSATVILNTKEKLIEGPRRSSISIDNDEAPQSPKVHFKLQQNSPAKASQKIVISHSQNQMNLSGSSRKTNLKLNKSSFVQSNKSQKNIKSAGKLNEPIQGKNLDKLLKQIQNYHFHNQKMKQNYEELMQQYCKTNQATFSDLRVKINQLTNKFNHITIPQLSNQPLKQQLTHKIEQLKFLISNKLDRPAFEKTMNDFNTRFFGLHEERKKLANRDETKRALQFLQSKVNSMLNQYYQARKVSLHHVSVDKKGCLRVADIYDERTKNQYNRENIFDHIQNTAPPTIRNQSSSTLKRQSTSVHSRLLHYSLTENRFNEKLWRPVSTQKGEHEQMTIRKPQKIHFNALKKKGYQILDKSKARQKPKIKKQRLIFQYD